MSVVLDRTVLADVQEGRAEACSMLEELIEVDVPLVVPTVALPKVLSRSSDLDGDVERIREAAEVVPFTLEDARDAAASLRFRWAAVPVEDPTAILVEATAVGRPRMPVVTRRPRRYGRCPTRSY